MWLIAIGVLSGIMGSMGLGGGSVLIPLLSLMSIGQKSAQVINVFSFVLMAVFIVFINVKNKLVESFSALIFGLFGGIVATFLALFVSGAEQSFVKICFGIFLLLVGSYELFAFLTKYRTK